MQVKKYLAPTLKIAAEKMKSELGDDAVILSTRVLKESESPGNKMFELTAGIDGDLNYTETVDPLSAQQIEPPKNFEEELNRISNRIFKNASEIEKQLGIPVKEKMDEGINKKEKVQKIGVADIINKLEAEEIGKPIIKKILAQLKKYGNLLKVSNLDNYIISTIASMIPTAGFNVTKSSRPKVVSLVGPTGVGKTTCIAKLAIISKILHKLDVGLISIDTFRIGALDQLKIFSDVSHIDMLVAYEPEDLEEIMNQFKNKDVIFVDTAGRSQKNSAMLNEARNFLNRIKIDETYLVLSSTSTTKTLFDTTSKFKMFNYSSLIFTKIDEGAAFGNILNVITKINVPSVFLTNGQVIPDDIIASDADYMAKLIYTGKAG